MNYQLLNEIITQDENLFEERKQDNDLRQLKIINK